MAETLFIDGRAGAAGDMLLAALIDVGASSTAVRRTLRSLPLDGWTLAVRRIERGGLVLRDVRVRARPGRHRRTWPAIRRLLRGGELPPRARDRALAVFRRLFEAEAAVHGADPQRVHLHEAGAVDAIVDIAGCCVALELLGRPEVVVSRLTTGFGRVRCAHGVYPVPAPATLELLRGIPVEAGAVEAERVTPTGAALLVELADSWAEMPALLPRTPSTARRALGSSPRSRSPAP